VTLFCHQCANRLLNLRYVFTRKGGSTILIAQQFTQPATHYSTIKSSGKRSPKRSPKCSKTVQKAFTREHFLPKNSAKTLL
jgi:hypothetical protein